MFKDEEVIQERYWKRREKFTGIETGIYSGEDFLEFSEVKIFDDKVLVVLPTTFEDMSEEDAKKKYPSQQRPQLIKTNGSGTVNFAFNLVEERIEPAQLEKVAYDFTRVLKRLYPTNICLKLESGQGMYLPYAFVEFTSMAIDENLFNMVVFTPIEEQLLLLLFNCPFDRRMEWTKCLVQIREQIADLSKEAKDEAN